MKILEDELQGGPNVRLRSERENRDMKILEDELQGGPNVRL